VGFIGSTCTALPGVRGGVWLVPVVAMEGEAADAAASLVRAASARSAGSFQTQTHPSPPPVIRGITPPTVLLNLSAF